MAPISETGHAKNVANFQDLIAFCQSYGTAYNPSKENLKMPQLQLLYQEVQDQLPRQRERPARASPKDIIKNRKSPIGNLKVTDGKVKVSTVFNKTYIGNNILNKKTSQTPERFFHTTSTNPNLKPTT